MVEHRPSPVPGAPPVPWRAALAAWGAFACLAAFYLLYVTPRRGVLFSDEAWYLYNAVRALHHGEIASYLPQAPAHLFNAFSMIFLGDGYLPQRYVFILANMAAGVALLAGVGGKKALATSLPLGLGCVLVAGLSSVINYQNGPGLFLCLGLGLYFLGDRAAGPVAAWTLSTAAGFFLAASAMANLTVTPGLAMICLGLLWRAWRTGRLRRAVGPLACGLFFGAMLGAYAAALGLERLFHVPKGHGFLYGRLGEIVLLAVAWPAFWGGFAGVAALWRRRGHRTDPVAWGLWLLVSAAAALLVKAILVACGGRVVFPLDPLPTLNPVILLPHYAYGLLCLGLLHGALTRGTTDQAWRRGLGAALALLLYWAQQTFYSEIFVTFSMVFISGFMMALGLLLLSLPALPALRGGRDVPGRGRAGALFLAALVFVGGSLGYLETGGWTGETRLSGPKVELDNPRLRGILESPERAAMLAAVERAYAGAGCREKALLCFNNASLLHYVLDHPAPPGLSYIPQPTYFEPEIREIVEGKKPWCVLYSASYRRPGTAQREEAFMQDLAARAAERRVLGDPSSSIPYTDFVLFLGPAPMGQDVPGPDGGTR
ncbi:hypothetical protein G3N56_15500 [Desulfovibrio sulfodismutans]|uniref:Glycosyltransferase RgtA/B/C/D-like domain-containing protein n=1 Tax=Desulfolutivibrio sulfodismutans TaxID=63561 RepID=A0A7K3NPN2_9BACT|nr:hypothetical protein [Desulfolutivibrio sulfodismutans]NDY58140.1 hypothetical protein [Desulfolutivibrio sulfodismutans]QLA14611.1 hypothetical protein GD606_19890 [Desulfolutivibrio sulfodismutans DSM 3696]